MLQLGAKLTLCSCSLEALAVVFVKAQVVRHLTMQPRGRTLHSCGCVCLSMNLSSCYMYNCLDSLSLRQYGIDDRR